MATGNQRDVAWKDDERLQGDLDRYVRQNLKRAEILQFMERDFSAYSWSLPTLDRRLRHFNIWYIDQGTSLEEVTTAVRDELNGPGQLLGYRAMNQKLRMQHNIKVPRHLVHTMLADLDPDGLDARNLKKRIKRKKGNFKSDGPLWLISLDGHDKLCGYQNWTFPFGIYGCMDTFSRKILFIFITYSNSNPDIIGKKYIEFLYETRTLPSYLRIDKGTETGKMTTIHTYLIDKLDKMEDATDSILYGPSTSNKIERWWRDLHERLEKYFKNQLSHLLRSTNYDPNCLLDRQLLFYTFTPVLQQQCDIFTENWNSHRIRQQKIELPTGVPDHMFAFPEQYGGAQFGTHIEKDHIKEVAELSGVLGAPADIDERVAEQCKHIIPYPEQIEVDKLKESYIFLKEQYQLRP